MRCTGAYAVYSAIVRRFSLLCRKSAASPPARHRLHEPFRRLLFSLVAPSCSRLLRFAVVDRLHAPDLHDAAQAQVPPVPQAETGQGTGKQTPRLWARTASWIRARSRSSSCCRPRVEACSLVCSARDYSHYDRGDRSRRCLDRAGPWTSRREPSSVPLGRRREGCWKGRKRRKRRWKR